jgi:tryptophan-rich sensory protein
MTKELIIRDLIICLVLIVYFIITIRFYFNFKKEIIFTGKIKTFHLIMIWLIPFIWIVILKSLANSAPGSYEVKSKNNSKPYSDNDSDAMNASNMGF